MADSSKTEQATPKRRSKAREKGQVARSRELPGVFALAGVAGVTALMAPTVSHSLDDVLSQHALCRLHRQYSTAMGRCSSGARLK